MSERRRSRQGAPQRPVVPPPHVLPPCLPAFYSHCGRVRVGVLFVARAAATPRGGARRESNSGRLGRGRRAPWAAPSRGIRAAPRRGAVSSHRLAQASSARPARFCAGTASRGGWGMWSDCCLCRGAGMLVRDAAKAMRGRRAGKSRIRWVAREGPKGPGPELRARPDARASPARLVQPRVGPSRVLVVPPPAAPSRARPSPPALLVWPLALVLGT